MKHPIDRRKAITQLAAGGLLAALGTPRQPAMAQAAPPSPPPPSSTAALPVVASFSILADLVRQVGGPLVQVTSLVGPDGDAHAFSPGAQDARRLQAARVLVTNGLGFEAWLARLKTASGFKGLEVVASEGVQARRFDGGEAQGGGQAGKPGHDHDHNHDQEHEHGHAHGPWDPHAWQDVANAMRYVRNIAAGLAAADPSHAGRYHDHAAAYVQQLQVLDGDIRAAVARIPARRRQLVTTHDAFGYFSQAYGVRFIGARGLSNESEPSAADIARLASQIRHDGIAAVFLENIGDPRLMEQLARETGATVGGKLHSDALSPAGQPGDSYIGMMRSNLQALSQALGGGA